MSRNKNLFKTFTSLAYIANVIWAVLFSILLIGCILNGEAILNAAPDSINPEGFFGSLIALFLVLSIVVVTLCVLSILGLNKMRANARKGYFLYVISNGVWALLQIYIGSDGTIFYLASGLISIVFIFYFTVQLPKFK
ncbi:hypothetical protein [Crocinitomix algicola]|uniref:hypothetical protein n=1 Tax=Crocinitomix algicola TaxID=1740263 RepID=UPI00082D9E2B|nr:hypothetical protein [Crocinitomix algicola]